MGLFSKKCHNCGRVESNENFILEGAYGESYHTCPECYKKNRNLRVEKRYDSRGNLIYEKSYMGNETWWGYDAKDRLTLIKCDTGFEEHRTYED